ncbi:hypothetical protein ACOSQ3_014103 [Xanthoceras sorbifolium]
MKIRGTHLPFMLEELEKKVIIFTRFRQAWLRMKKIDFQSFFVKPNETEENKHIHGRDFVDFPDQWLAREISCGHAQFYHGLIAIKCPDVWLYCNEIVSLALIAY